MNTKNVYPKIIMIWLFIFSFLPAIMLFVLSFMTPDIKSIAKLPLTFHHYLTLIEPLFLKIAWRSFYLAGFATLICLIISYPFAYFVLQIKNKAIVVILILIPFWTSSLIRTYAMVDLLKWHGTINSILLKLHLIDTPLHMLYSNSAVLLGLVYNLLPFMILPIYNGMQTIDFRCIDAAKDLGAKPIQIFLKVFWPQSQKGVISGMLMVFLPAMTLFYIPNILGGAKSILIGNLIQNEFLFLNNWPQGAASSTLLSFILIGLFIATQSKGMEK
ncbi:MAG TPA: spermidine/putrescine ABC transporter permease [Legionellales bacterium]|jgi:spermidine/putrescine transport system permease protein|nr:spermidine/putrescine ABC transporter permease [Legionellales bacterium]